MPPRLPIAVDDILKAITETTCSSCYGMGTWRKKTRCEVCNGKGTTGVINDSCSICQGRGQVATEDRRAADCAVCDGFGVLYSPCLDCGQCGFNTDDMSHCDRCSGSGEVRFASEVALRADRHYLRHLIAKLSEYAEKATILDIGKACALGHLLNDVLKQARDTQREKELFSVETRISLGDAQMALLRHINRCEEQMQRDRRDARTHHIVELTRLRSEAMQLQENTKGSYWDGLGHRWDS